MPGRDDYEQRKIDRIDRLESAADKAQARSDQAYRASRKAVEHIPLGQPILVGHHSERGHRRDLKRADDAMRKCVEEQHNAQTYARRAASAEESTAISSDDPSATEKLHTKLDELEADRDRMKAMNAAWRRAGKPGIGPEHGETWKRIAQESGILPKHLVGIIKRVIMTPYHPMPFPPYSITNIGARIRQAKTRIEHIEAVDTADVRDPITGEGWEISEDRDINRVRIDFDKKPGVSMRGMLKANGFRWNRTEAAWTRLLSNGAWYAACRAMGCPERAT